MIFICLACGKKTENRLAFDKKTKDGRIPEEPVRCSDPECVYRDPANHNPYWAAPL